MNNTTLNTNNTVNNYSLLENLGSTRANHLPLLPGQQKLEAQTLLKPERIIPIQGDTNDVVKAFEETIDTLITQAQKKPSSIHTILETVNQLSIEAAKKLESETDPLGVFQVKKKAMEAGELIVECAQLGATRLFSNENLNTLSSFATGAVGTGIKMGRYKVLCDRVKELAEIKVGLVAAIADANEKDSLPLIDSKERIDAALIVLQEDIEALRTVLKTELPAAVISTGLSIGEFIIEQDLIQFTDQALESFGAVLSDISLAGNLFALVMNFHHALKAHGQIQKEQQELSDLQREYTHLTKEEQEGPFGQIITARLDRVKQRLKDQKIQLAKGITKVGTSSATCSLALAQTILSASGVTVGTTGAAVLGVTGVGLVVVGGTVLILGTGYTAYKNRHNIRHLSVVAQERIGEGTHVAQKTWTQHAHSKSCDKISKQEKAQKEFQERLMAVLEKAENLENSNLNPKSLRRQSEKLLKELNKANSENLKKQARMDSTILSLNRKRTQVDKVSEKMKGHQMRIESSKKDRDLKNLTSRFATHSHTDLERVLQAAQHGLNDENFRNNMSRLMKAFGTEAHPKLLNEKKIFDFVTK